MDLNDIKIRSSICHVLNSKQKQFILSSEPVQYEPEFQEYFKRHILMLLKGDDVKHCEFREHSEVLEIIKTEEDFVILSQKIAKELYQHMEQHEGIMPADFIIQQIDCEGIRWLALLKMNYVVTYTHNTAENEVILHSDVFPKSSTKLKEAALINLDDLSVRVLEKKFEVNDIKANYFSGLFLKCRSQLSEKEKIRIIKHSFDLVRDKFIHQEFKKAEYSLKFKTHIVRQFIKGGEIDTHALTKEAFKDHSEAKDEFVRVLKKHELDNSRIIPKSTSVNKICRHKIVTDTGIEIIIPVQYSNYEDIELKRDKNGTITIFVKNVESFKNL